MGICTFRYLPRAWVGPGRAMLFALRATSLGTDGSSMAPLVQRERLLARHPSPCAHTLALPAFGLCGASWSDGQVGMWESP